MMPRTSFFATKEIQPKLDFFFEEFEYGDTCTLTPPNSLIL